MSRTQCFSVFLTLLLVLPAVADVNSGPPVGDKLPSIKVFDATGMHKDKDVDYAAERKDKPTIYVVINEWDRPTARLLKTLDREIKEDAEDAYIVAVWLTDEVNKIKEHLPRVQESLQLQTTAMTVFPGEKRGPDGWNINDKAHATVAIVNKNKVAATFGYVSVNETDAAAVRKALQKALGK